MTPLSVTQLEAKRKAVFVPSLHNLVQELERELDERLQQPPTSDDMQRSRDKIRDTVMQNCRDVVAQYEAREPEWFMHDQHYQLAVQEAAALKRVALAKVQRIWQAQVQGWSAACDAFNQWKPKLLSVINVEVLNELKRLWEASREPSSGETEPAAEERKKHALALCEWLGLVDTNDLDMVVDLEGHTPLQIAAVSGNVTTLAMLLDAGCKPELKNKSEQNALYLAASEGHAEAVSMLLEVTSVLSDIDAKDKVRMRP